MDSKNPILIIASDKDESLYHDFPLTGEQLLVIPYGQAVCSMVFREIDLVLLDCGFDLQLGITVLEDLKLRFPEVPVLLLADHSSEEIILQAFHKGARDFIRKPFHVFQLRDQIMELLKVKRASREYRGRFPVAENNGAQVGSLCGVVEGMSPAIMRTVCHLEKNYARRISLDEMAGLANMSKFHFSRVFQSQVGMSPVAYLKYVRVQRVKELLKRSELTIYSAAMQVGFSDISNFNKNFQKYEGCSPSQFRRRLA